MDKKRILLVLVLLFAAVYYIGRIGIFAIAATGDMAFENEQSALVEGVVSGSFLMIGLVGLLMLPGLYLHRPWGFWGTIVISAYTIAFDVWAYIWVQTSAIAGVIPAGIVLGYLLLVRKDFMVSSSTK